MRSDPAWFTTGLTANTAAARTGLSSRASRFPTTTTGSRKALGLTYLLPAEAPVTVLTRQGDPPNFGATPITVSRAGAARARRSQSTVRANSTGVWIRVNMPTSARRPAVPAVAGPRRRPTASPPLRRAHHALRLRDVRQLGAFLAVGVALLLSLMTTAVFSGLDAARTIPHARPPSPSSRSTPPWAGLARRDRPLLLARARDAGAMIMSATSPPPPISRGSLVQ